MNTESINKRLGVAKVITSIGVLFFIVPVGLSIVSYITSQGQQPLRQLVTIGWAFWVTFWLLPLGLACLVGGLSWVMILKRSLKVLLLSNAEKKS